MEEGSNIIYYLCEKMNPVCIKYKLGFIISLVAYYYIL